MANQRRYTDEQLACAIAESYSFREAAIKLGVPGSSGARQTSLKQRAINLGLDTAHFLGRMTLSRRGMVPWAIKPPEFYFQNGKWHDGFILKKKLAEIGRPLRCELCGTGNQWNGKPLTLQIDHVDGNNKNCLLDNLRFLCPNCHSQTPTFTGRKLRKIKVNHANAGWRTRPRPHGRKVMRPDRNTLLEDLRMASWRSVARKYGVSDNAVRKWASSYRLENDGVQLGFKTRNRRRCPSGGTGDTAVSTTAAPKVHGGSNPSSDI